MLSTNLATLAEQPEQDLKHGIKYKSLAVLLVFAGALLVLLR